VSTWRRSGLGVAGIMACVAMLLLACEDGEVAAPEATPAPVRALDEVPAGSAVLVGAGNIARCDRLGDELTSLLLDSVPGTVFAAGDNAWNEGTLTQYQLCYGPSWGRHLARTRRHRDLHVERGRGHGGPARLHRWHGLHGRRQRVSGRLERRLREPLCAELGTSQGPDGSRAGEP
jgi:hypothetical protein